MRKNILTIIMFVLVSISSAQIIDSISFAKVDTSGNISPILDYYLASDGAWTLDDEVKKTDYYRKRSWYFYEFNKPMIIKTEHLTKDKIKQGIRSNYREPLNSFVSRNVGIAVSEKIELGLFNFQGKKTPTWSKMSKFLKQIIFKKEKCRYYYDTLSKVYGNPLKFNFNNFELWNAKIHNYNLYYVRMIEYFGPSKTMSHVYYYAWIREVNNNFEIISDKIIVDDIDFKLTNRLTPISLMEINDRKRILVIDNDWDGPCYYILSLTDSSVW